MQWERSSQTLYRNGYTVKYEALLCKNAMEVVEFMLAAIYDLSLVVR
jgi:hypothetical protein